MVRDILFAFICTVLVGFFADGWIGSWLNWPDAGAIFAVATMGCFILHAVNKKRGKDDDTNETYCSLAAAVSVSLTAAAFVSE